MAAACAGAWGSAPSVLEIASKLGTGERTIDVAEGAFLLHFARGVDESAHRRAPERGSEADAPHAGFLEFGHAERLGLHPRHEVHRFGQRAANLAHRVQV